MSGLGPFTGTLRDAAGNQLVIGANGAQIVLAAPTPGPTPPDPTPSPDPIPAGADTVRIGTATYPLAGVNPTADTNPTGKGYPGFRGPNQLLIYGPPWTRTGTNKYGAEIAVRGGALAGSMTVQGGDLPIPTDGFVLSGHGAAETWLLDVYKPGAKVEILHVDQPSPAPSPTPPAPSPTPPPAAVGRTIAMYLMRGSAGSAALAAARAAGVNQARVAFLQGSPLGLVDWGGEPVAALASALADLRTGGGTALAAVGGQDGGVPGSDAAALVAGVRAAEMVVGTRDGWDVDIEASAINVPVIVQAAVELAKGREQTWVTSFVPPGGDPVPLYLEAARQCVAAGLRVQVGQQLYGASGQHITLSDALRQTDLAVKTLGDPSRVLIGMWIGSAIEQWTLAEAQQVMASVLAKWPTIGGCYAWTGSGAEVPAWAAAMQALPGWQR